SVMITVFTPLFFFQAEDGIRDRNVTGVQTCALPISGVSNTKPSESISHDQNLSDPMIVFSGLTNAQLDYALSSIRRSGAGSIPRSEERRVGKECRSWCCASSSK